MRAIVLSFALLCGLSAQAQLLPVPDSENPDWVLLKTEKRPYDGQIIRLPATDAMPNAAQKSISSSGDHHHYWDAEHQLAYDWFSQGTSMAPFILVNVREQRKDLVYVYRRKRSN